MKRLTPSSTKRIVAALAIAGLATYVFASRPTPAAPTATAKPALTVTATSPQTTELSHRLSANGSVSAWQEASLGSEANGLRLTDIKVNVGSQVKRGDVLAQFTSSAPQAEQMQARASVAEAEANWQEAHANAERARAIINAGALSAQQISQYLASESASQARLEAAKANLALADLHLAQTRIVASDDGVISFRATVASVGAVIPQGQELFRLIRQNRLEWRAEVTADELARLKPGQAVALTAGSARSIGKVRTIAPTVDTHSRNGLVYVDLPASASNGANPAFKAGMFAKGDFDLGKSRALTLPRQAVVLRDGQNFVFLIDQNRHVVQTKVQVGRRDAERVEITDGLPASAQVVASGAGFLNHGDLVQLTDNSPANTPAGGK